MEDERSVESNGSCRWPDRPKMGATVDWPHDHAVVRDCSFTVVSVAFQDRQRRMRQLLRLLISKLRQWRSR